MWKKLSKFPGFLLLVLGSGALIWGVIPSNRTLLEVDVQPEVMRISQVSGEKAGIREERQIRLETSKTIRIADNSTIRLDFIPTATSDGHIDSNNLDIDAYLRYSVVAEARLEMAGVVVTSPNPIQESLPVGEAINFRWGIKAFRPGIYKGSAWLRLRFLPLDGSDPIEKPIYVQDVEFEATSLFGLSGAAARIGGAILCIVGAFVLAGDMFQNRKTRRTLLPGINHQSQ